MHTYTVGFIPEVGIKSMTYLADRIEFPRPSDPEGTHIKFYTGNELVGSVNPEFVYMTRKETQ